MRHSNAPTSHDDFTQKACQKTAWYLNYVSAFLMFNCLCFWRNSYPPVVAVYIVIHVYVRVRACLY